MWGVKILGEADWRTYRFDVLNTLEIVKVTGKSEQERLVAELVRKVIVIAESENEDDFPEELTGMERGVLGNSSLYAMLAKTTQGPAHDIVRGLENERHGAKAWLRLKKRFDKTGAATYADVLKFSWAGEYEEAWRKFVYNVGRLPTSIGDGALESLAIEGAAKMGQKAIEDGLRLRSPQAWGNVVEMVDKYLETMKANDEPAPMDIGSANAQYGGHVSLVEQKPKGKGNQGERTMSMGRMGKGGASVQKYCYCCGKTGHSRAECWMKEKECRVCKKVGHMERTCYKGKGGKGMEAQRGQPDLWRRPAYGGKGGGKQIQAVVTNEVDTSKDEWVMAARSGDETTQQMGNAEDGARVQWLVDSGADVHLVPRSVYELAARTDQGAVLRECAVRVKGVNGMPLKVDGVAQLQMQTPDGRKVVLEAVVSPDAKECILSATRVRDMNRSIVLQPDGSFIVDMDGGKQLLRRDGRGRDVLELKIGAVTTSILKRDLKKLTDEVRSMRKQALMPEAQKGEMGDEAMRLHLRSGHAKYDPRCEGCVQTRAVVRHGATSGPKTVNFDYMMEGSAVVLVGAGPEGEAFARVVPRKGAKMQDVVAFLQQIKARHGDVTVRCDQEQALQQALITSTNKVGLRLEMTPVEQSAANGNAERMVREMRERLEVLRIDIKKKTGLALDAKHPAVEYLVRHAEWVRNVVRKRNYGHAWMSIYEAQTGNRAAHEKDVAQVGERILVRAREVAPKQPRFTPAWCLGFREGDVIALSESGEVRMYGAWKRSPENNSESDKAQLRTALGKMKVKEEKTAGCRMCFGDKTAKGEHSNACKQVVVPARVPPTHWPELVAEKKDEAEKGHGEKEAQDADGSRTRAKRDRGADAVNDEAGAMKRMRQEVESAEGDSPAMDVSRLEATIAKFEQLQEDMLKEAADTLHDENDSLVLARTKEITKCSPMEAKQKELAQFEEMGVFEEVSNDEMGSAKAVAGRWVMTEKAPDCWKARFVAKGFQEEGDEYELNFAATALLTTARMVMAKALSNGWGLHVVDVKGAFLNAKMGESDEVYVRPPKEWTPKTKTGKKVMWKLKRALYGLRSAPRRWQEHFEELLQSHGMEQSKIDTCMWAAKDKKLVLCYHVDDVLVTGTECAVKSLTAHLQQKVEMKSHLVGSEWTRFLGRRLRRSGVSIDFGVGSDYLEELLGDFGYTTIKPVRNLTWCADAEGQEELQPDGQSLFRRILGRLLWMDRPDVTVALLRLAGRVNHATEQDFRNIVRVLRYLRGNPMVACVKEVVVDKPAAKKMPVGSVWTFCDSDYGGGEERKSRTGLVCLVKGDDEKWYPVTTQSKRQAVVALSSGEAELYAVVKAATESIGNKQLSETVFGGQAKKMALATDSAAAYGIVGRKGASRRVRHIEVRAFFTQEFARRDDTVIVKVKGEENLADGLTKVGTAGWNMLMSSE